MSRPIDQQLRHYFEHVEREQAGVDVDAVVTGGPHQPIPHSETDEETIMSLPERNRSNRTWTAVAAAALVIAVVGAVAVALGAPDDDGEEPAPADAPDSESAVTLPRPLTAEDVAVAAVEAIDARDVAGLDRLLRLDARIDLFNANDPSDLPLMLDWFAATDFRFELEGCTPDATDGEVVCSVRQRNAWSDAIDHDGVAGRFTIAVVDDSVSALEYFWEGGWGPLVVGYFGTFVRRSDPAAFEEIWSGTTPYEGANLTPEAIALFERYTDEFVAAQDDG